MNYKALALDLDGTLTNSQKKISDGNKAAVAHAIRQGKVVILASGRPELGVVPVAEELNLNELGGYILAYNGGKIVNCKTGEVLREATIPTEYHQAIYDSCKQFGIELLAYDDEGILSENPDDIYVQKEAFCNSCPIKKVDHLLDAVEGPTVKFLAVGEHPDLVKLGDYVNEQYGDRISAYFSEPYFLEIISKGIEKAASLALLNEKLGFTREELIACGDGFNDITMLKYAGLSVVMDNASDEVKQYADYIAPSNDEDGVAHVIEKFL